MTHNYETKKRTSMSKSTIYRMKKALRETKISWEQNGVLRYSKLVRSKHI